jgi:hypothetical protein
MSRPQAADVLEVELAFERSGGRRERLDQERDVVADVEPVQHPPGEPLPAGLQHRAGRVRVSAAAAELVHGVAGRLSEQRRQRPVLGAERVGDQSGGPGATGTVWLRRERHSRNRVGSMLHWVAKPTRQPARSQPASAVTISMG